MVSSLQWYGAQSHHLHCNQKTLLTQNCVAKKNNILLFVTCATDIINAAPTFMIISLK